jgi:hypothetical protein
MTHHLSSYFEKAWYVNMMNAAFVTSIPSLTPCTSRVTWLYEIQIPRNEVRWAEVASCLIYARGDFSRTMRVALTSLSYRKDRQVSSLCAVLCEKHTCIDLSPYLLTSAHLHMSSTLGRQSAAQAICGYSTDYIFLGPGEPWIATSIALDLVRSPNSWHPAVSNEWRAECMNRASYDMHA